MALKIDNLLGKEVTILWEFEGCQVITGIITKINSDRLAIIRSSGEPHLIQISKNRVRHIRSGEPNDFYIPENPIFDIWRFRLG